MRSSLATIVGIGTTTQGELPGLSADEIAVRAFVDALSDSRLDKADIDGLITCRSHGAKGVDTDIGKLAGLAPDYSATLDYGTCNFSLHLAVMAIRAGLCSTVAIMYGTNQRTASNRFASASTDADFTAPHGFFNVAGPAAMAFRRHQWQYGTTEEQLGHVAVNQREYAQLNPGAIFRQPLTLDDYLNSRYIVEPLRRPDITMISDGGACLIVSASQRAGPHQAVHVLGMSQATNLRDFQHPKSLSRDWIRPAATRLYHDADVTTDDIDVLFIQDPFSVWVLQMLELYGFCGMGEGGPFIAEGHTRRGGRLPVNTNGGQLSEAYMWGWLHLIEAVRQLRGSAGPRQVPRARVAQYCSTMALKKAAATVLANELP